MRYIKLIVFILILASCAQPEEGSEEGETGRELEYISEVSFIKPDGEIAATVTVAIADDDHTRNLGLMDVQNLPEDSGMLFIFEDEEPRSFWMANTPLPLDIIYANADHEIVRIHRNTPPYSNESFTSEEPAMYVVEVNAGFTIRHDITEQMTIRIES
ncbi:MAG: DUF192 domain-containing protein [Balneolaceae bacterium]